MWFSLIMAQSPDQTNSNKQALSSKSLTTFNEWVRNSFLQTPIIFICVLSDHLEIISEGTAMRRLVAPKITMRAPCGLADAQIKQTKTWKSKTPLVLSYHEIERISFLQTPNIFICVASDPLDLISEGKVMRRLVAHVIFTQYQDWKGAPSSYILYGFQTRKRNYFCHMQSLKGSNLTTCNPCLYLLTLHCQTMGSNCFWREGSTFFRFRQQIERLFVKFHCKDGATIFGAVTQRCFCHSSAPYNECRYLCKWWVSMYLCWMIMFVSYLFICFH